MPHADDRGERFGLRPRAHPRGGDEQMIAPAVAAGVIRKRLKMMAVTIHPDIPEHREMSEGGLAGG